MVWQRAKKDPQSPVTLRALCSMNFVLSNEALCRNTELADQGANLRQSECPFPLQDLPCPRTAALEDRLEVFWRFAKSVEMKTDSFDRIEAFVDPVVRVAALVSFHENGQRFELVEGDARFLRCFSDQLVDLTQSASMVGVRSNRLECSHGLDFRHVDLVVFRVGSHEPDIERADGEERHDDEPVAVATDVEHNPVLANETGTGEVPFDVAC